MARTSQHEDGSLVVHKSLAHLEHKHGLETSYRLRIPPDGSATLILAHRFEYFGLLNARKRGGELAYDAMRAAMKKCNKLMRVHIDSVRSKQVSAHMASQILPYRRALA